MALHGNLISELRSVTWRMASHSVTSHLIRVNAFHLINPVDRPEGWKVELTLIYRDGNAMFVDNRQSPIQIVTT